MSSRGMISDGHAQLAEGTLSLRHFAEVAGDLAKREPRDRVTDPRLASYLRIEERVFDPSRGHSVAKARGEPGYAGSPHQASALSEPADATFPRLERTATPPLVSVIVCEAAASRQAVRQDLTVSQDPDALRKAAEAVRVLEDRLAAIAQGQADVAKSLHETADGLLVHKADDDGLTAANLDMTADALR